MNAKKVAVLDIGSDAITLVMQDNKYANNFTFKASADYDGYQDGEFLDIQGLFRAVDALVKECEATTFTKLTEIMVGVPGSFTAVVCRTVEHSLGSVRKVTDRDVDALYALGNAYEGDPSYTCISASPVHFSLDDQTVTITPVGQLSAHLNCLMSYVICENAFINLFNKISETVGVAFVYTSATLAEVMYVVPDELRDEGIILLDVGYIATTVAYAKGDGILHAVSFDLGRGHIAADLTMVEGIPYEHSLALTEKLNLNLEPGVNDEYAISVGSETFHYNINKVNAISYDRVYNIAEFVHRGLGYSKYDIPPFTRILLTGSGLSNVAGAKECIAKVTGKSVEILSPNLMQFNKPRYSSLAGLLVVQQHQIVKKKLRLFSKLFNFKDKFNRRNKK